MSTPRNSTASARIAERSEWVDNAFRLFNDMRNASTATTEPPAAAATADTWDATAFREALTAHTWQAQFRAALRRHQQGQQP